MPPGKSRVARFVAVATTLLALVASAAGPLEDEDWIEVSTPNFRIVSLLSEKKTKDLLLHLELLRRAFLAMTNAESTDAAVPTRFYVAGKNDFAFLAGMGGTVGAFLPDMRENKAIVRTTRWADESSVIMHEYVHHLMAAYSGARYPHWYSEGFAQYFGYAEFRGGRFVVGAVAEGRLPSLRYRTWITSEKLLSSDLYATLDAEERLLFYAQAWLLVHYLQNSEEKAGTFAEEWDLFLDLTEAGEDEVRSFEKAFRIRPSQLRSELTRYLNRECCNTFRFEVDVLLPEFQPVVRKLSRPEAALNLAWLAATHGADQAAMDWFDTAAEHNPIRGRALSDSADILRQRGDFALAEERLASGIKLAPRDAYVHLNLARYWLARAAEHDDPGNRARQVENAQQSVFSAWQIDSTIPEIYVLNGYSFLLGEENATKAVEYLEASVRSLPSDPSIRLLLARAYLQAGREADAIAFAQSVTNLLHVRDSVRKYAEEIIGSANGRLENRQPLDDTSLPEP